MSILHTLPLSAQRGIVDSLIPEERYRYGIDGGEAHSNHDGRHSWTRRCFHASDGAQHREGRLDGRIALVTGASRGVGAGIARPVAVSLSDQSPA